MEFAGGTLTVPSNMNCDINLYNHFKEYFQVDYKIPMFLFHTVGESSPQIYTEILKDYQVFRKTFSSDKNPQIISYFTFGPKLCWGRHSRWRAQFDIFNENATTAVDVAVVSGVVYYWKIVAIDAEGNQSDSGVYTFRTN